MIPTTPSKPSCGPITMTLLGAATLWDCFFFTKSGLRVSSKKWIAKILAAEIVLELAPMSHSNICLYIHN